MILSGGSFDSDPIPYTRVQRIEAKRNYQEAVQMIPKIMATYDSGLESKLDEVRSQRETGRKEHKYL